MIWLFTMMDIKTTYIIKCQIKNLPLCYLICILYFRTSSSLISWKLGSSLRGFIVVMIDYPYIFACLDNAIFLTCPVLFQPSFTDVNECVLGSHTCDRTNGICKDTVSGFLCECKPGYTGNGHTCKGKWNKLYKHSIWSCWIFILTCYFHYPEKLRLYIWPAELLLVKIELLICFKSIFQAGKVPKSIKYYKCWLAIVLSMVALHLVLYYPNGFGSITWTRSDVALLPLMDYFTLYFEIPYSHYALTILSLYSHYTLTILSLYSHYTLTILSLYSHYTLTILSLYSHYTLTILSLCYTTTNYCLSRTTLATTNN